jgi:hypothetical protein
MKIENRIETALEKRFQIPEYVKACAGAIRHDLLFGPTWSKIPNGEIEQFNCDCSASYPEDLEAGSSDIVEETYTGKVADTLRDFMLSLPSELYFDADFEEILENEPESWQDDETGEWIDPYEFGTIYKIEQKEIISGLFGNLLAKEFSL